MVEVIEKPQPESGRLGAKVLSFPDVIAQSVGFMGPVFTSAFVIPLVVGVASVTGKGGGIASPLSVLIAGVGVFAIGWIVSSYAKEVRTAGSLYEYVTRGLGQRIGTAAGWMYYAGVTMLTAALLLILGGYLQSTIASEFSVNPLPGWAWRLGLEPHIPGDRRPGPVLRRPDLHPRPARASADFHHRGDGLLHFRHREAGIG
jgi:amino acid transporter